MTPQQLASARCHALLTELIELSVVIDGKVVASAHDEEHALQVVIFLTRWDRPRFVPAPGFDEHGQQLKPPEKAIPRDMPLGADKDHGSPAATCIMEAAPEFHEDPVTARKLVKLAGYSYTGYTRKIIDGLVEQGKLIRTSRGIRKCAPRVP